MREDVDLLLDARRRRRGRRSTTSCCSAWAARRSRPRCCGSAFGGERLPRARHDASRRDPRAAGEARPRAHAVHLGVEVGLDARDALAHRLLLEARAARRAVGRDHRSRLGARRRSRASGVRARSSPGEPTIGGRYSALSPFGLVPAALLGVDLARLLDRALRDGRRLPPRRGQPGPRARARARRTAGGRAATRSASRTPDGFGLWVEQLHRRVDRQGGQGPRAGAGRVGRRARPAGAGGSPARSRTSSARSSSAGSSRPRSPARSSASTPSTSRTCRRRRTGRTRCSPRGDVELEPRVRRSTSSSPRRRPRDYVCIQAFVDPTAARSERDSRALAARARRGDRLRRHARLRAALPALDRPAAQGRPEHRRLPPGGRGLRRRAGDPRPDVRLRRG